MIANAGIPHDAALPSLATALDARRMRNVLAMRFRALADAPPGLRIEDCRIERVKYKPGRSCLVCYALDLRDEASDRRYEQVLCGRVYPANESASRYTKAAREPLAAASIGTALVHLPALDMVLWAFPNERKLASLARLTDPAHLRHDTLPALVAALHGPGWRIEQSAHALVHYVPEHTCTVRVDLDLRRADGQARRAAVYGKAYYDDAGRVVGDAMRRLWQSRAVQSGALGIARPLAYDEHDRVLWQEGLEGETLDRRHPGDDAPAPTLRRVAGALAALHATPLPGLPLARASDVLDDVRARADAIACACPHVLGHLRDVVAMLASTLPDDAPPATLHGDLHPKNVYLIRDGVWLIDLDNLHRGAPEQDLASWTACMLYRARLRGEPAGAAHAAARALVQAWEAARGAPVDAHALAWHTAAALIGERAHRLVTRLKPGRREILDDHVELARRSVER
jgi:hypothetical protein